MFQHFIEAARDFGHNFQLTSIPLDFEDAVFEAARVFWPTVIIKGCHFHLFQAWWRKIQSLGLATEYTSEESVIGKWLKVFFGLSFLNSVLHLIYFLAHQMIPVPSDLLTILCIIT
jgi:hypothetical protein